MTSAPAAVLNVKPPALREGARADVTLLDPDREWVIEPENFESKARNCPFAERKVRGRAVATIVRGRVVMREGRIVSPGADA
jgi:dihydroorotase